MAAAGESLRRSRFVVEHVGKCSFCGMRDGEVSALAGIAGQPHRICGECLARCVDIFCNDDEEEERSAMAAQLASFEPNRELREKVAKAADSGNVDGAVEAMREMGYSDVDPDQIRSLVESGFTDLSCSTDAASRPSATEHACSFCDARPGVVVGRVEVPGVPICDRCIGEASAAALAALAKA